MDSQPRANETSIRTCLGEQIHAATCEEHARVGRMITSRLFQALPPNSSDPKRYVQGLMAVASLFYCFEGPLVRMVELGRLQAAISKGEKNSEPDEDKAADEVRNQPPRPGGRSRLDFSWAVDLQKAVNLESMLRSPRIVKDIIAIMRNQEACESRHVPQDFVEMLVHVESNGRLRTKLEAFPHLVVAHLWCLYAAYRSGGQMIRRILLALPMGFWMNEMKQVDGPDFWAWTRSMTDQVAYSPSSGGTPRECGPVKLPPFYGPGNQPECTSNFLSFWDITPGEPSQTEFKEAIKMIGRHFTDGQRQEIAEEARGVFEGFSNLIKTLDSTCGSDLDRATETRPDAADD